MNKIYEPLFTPWKIKNVEIKIANPDKDGVGEILGKGPNIMLGYYENEEATKKALQDEELRQNIEYSYEKIHDLKKRKNML